MKVAITVWGNRISPVFDAAQTIMLAEISDASVRMLALDFVANSSGTGLAHALIEKEIDTLICGAISEQPARLIKSAGIRLIPFMAGNARKVLHAYAAGLSTQPFLMPGCCRRRQGHRPTPGLPDARATGTGSESQENKTTRYNHAERKQNPRD